MLGIAASDPMAVVAVTAAHRRSRRGVGPSLATSRSMLSHESEMERQSPDVALVVTDWPSADRFDIKDYGILAFNNEKPTLSGAEVIFMSVCP